MVLMRKYWHNIHKISRNYPALPYIYIQKIAVLQNKTWICPLPSADQKPYKYLINDATKKSTFSRQGWRNKSGFGLYPPNKRIRPGRWNYRTLPGRTIQRVSPDSDHQPKWFGDEACSIANSYRNFMATYKGSLGTFTFTWMAYTIARIIPHSPEGACAENLVPCYLKRPSPVLGLTLQNPGW